MSDLNEGLLAYYESRVAKEMHATGREVIPISPIMLELMLEEIRRRRSEASELLAAAEAVLPLVRSPNDWRRAEGYEHHSHSHPGIWDCSSNLCGECHTVERFKAAVDAARVG